MAKKKKAKKPTPPPAPVRKAPPRAAPTATGPTPKQVAKEQAARAERRDGLRRKLVAGGLATAAVAAVAAYVVVDRQRAAELEEALTSGSCVTDRESDRTGPAGQNHVQNPRYAVNPPAGGDHLTGAARGGVYGGTSVPADGLLVHSLEHGYVIYWHDPALPEDDVTALAQLEQERQGDVIVAERTGMDVPVAATAWGQRLLCQEVEPEALDRFAEAYVGEGPENVPRG